MQESGNPAQRDAASHAEVSAISLRASIWPSLKALLQNSSIEAWGFKIKLVEVVLAALVLAGTVYIGFKANHILSKQNDMLQSQLVTSERLGRQQNQAALLQAYIATAAASGFETEQQRRMLNVSLDLYSLLVQDNRKFTSLYTSMPSLTDAQLAQLIESRPGDRDEIRQLFARKNDIAQIGPNSAYRLVENAPFHIVIGTFRNPAYAREALSSAKQLLQDSAFRPFMNIVRNDDGFYLATLSGFASREEVLTAIRQERLQTRFSSVYASQTRGWTPVCSARFDACGPQLPKPA